MIFQRPDREPESILALYGTLCRVRKLRLMLCALPAVTVACAPLNAAAIDIPAYSTEFTRSIYAGAGLGFSRLEPDTSNAGGLEPDDLINGGGQVNFGVDLSRLFSLEIHSADLGSAGLSPTGRINYHTNGISGLLYVGGARIRHLRRGFTAYGRLGFGRLDNSPVGEVPFRKINSTHQLIGAGLEYTMQSGIGFRAEVISFDKDARYAQLGVIYRIGKRKRLSRIAANNEPALAAARVTEVTSPLLPKDNPRQVTLDIESTTTIAYGPCHADDVLLGRINFHTDSATLTEVAGNILGDIAAALGRCHDSTVTISAHTDSTGSDEYNQELSARRAQSVINYLTDIGVDRDRLTTKSYGESAPIDSNYTIAGRKNNRRAEILLR